MMKTKIRPLFVFLIANFVFAGITFGENSSNTYTLSIVPQMSAAKIEARWKPVIAFIEKETGVTLKLVHYKTIPEFEQHVVQADPDFAYMNPYHALRAHQIAGYEPLIRDKTKLLFGQLWVHTQSDIKKLKDLDDASIAFPAPNAFGASLYMRALLQVKEGVSFTPKYVKTHSNVYRHVAMKRSAAGGGVARTHKAEPDSLRKSLRLLYQTPGVRPHPFCAHPRVPLAVQEQVAAAMVLLGQGTDAEKNMAKAIAIPEPVRSNFAEDYQPLVDLNLSEFAEGAMK